MYTLLAVDDEELELKGICFLVDKFKMPFSVHTEKNGKEAVAWMEHNLPDIVLTDIKMPFLDGLELCQWVKQRYQNIPVIILSAYGDTPYMQRAIHLKADEYLLKPLVEADFKNMFEEYAVLLAKQEKQKEPTAAQIPIRKQETAKTERTAILNALAYIQQRYQEDISVAAVAKHCNLSSGYLGVQFKKITGKSILQYLTICRMEKAKELLIGTNMKIAEVGRAVGFDDTSYFCLTFRKFYGMTAVDMREGYGKQNI